MHSTHEPGETLAAEAGPKKIVLRPKQEKLLQMLRDRKSMTPQQIREGLGVSKQGAMDLLKNRFRRVMVYRWGLMDPLLRRDRF